MARQLRIEYAGAAYHVMARGNQGRPIYADDLDRKMWLKTLGEACEKTGWRIHAYVLMGNHYHVLNERLRMGHESGVSNGIRLVKAGGEAELEKSRKRLLKAVKDGAIN
jgi:REP element-mobilizing transposase RayT